VLHLTEIYSISINVSINSFSNAISFSKILDLGCHFRDEREIDIIEQIKSKKIEETV